MTGTNEFTTERLVMRRYHMDDSLILYKKFGCDPQMYKYSGWNPYASYDRMIWHTVLFKDLLKTISFRIFMAGRSNMKGS